MRPESDTGDATNAEKRYTSRFRRRSYPVPLERSRDKEKANQEMI